MTPNLALRVVLLRPVDLGPGLEEGCRSSADGLESRLQHDGLNI